MRRRPRPFPRGRVELQMQPGVIRHATIHSAKPDVRAIHLSFDHGELRVSVDVPDPAELVAELQRAMTWRDEPKTR